MNNFKIDYLERYTQTSLVYKKFDGKCFFTGIRCKLDVKHQHVLKASIEHLIPDKISKAAGTVRNNIVLSSNVINQVIGNAPISIKFELKNFLTSDLTKTAISKFDTDEEKMMSLKSRAKFFLSKYKIGNSYPWDYVGVYNHDQLRKKLFNAYVKLLTTEELGLLCKLKKIYFKNS
jgi:hypothetical protein